MVSRALRGARFDEVIDRGPVEPSTCAADGSCPRIARSPSVDVAVIAFPEGCPPALANALLSSAREGPTLARFDPTSLDVRGVRYRKWDEAAWEGAPRRLTLADDILTRATDDAAPPEDAVDFVTPYPASNFKLLVAVKVLELVDRGLVTLDQRVEHGGRARVAAAWLEDMITWSDDASAEALVRLLHATGHAAAVDATFARLGLATLQLHDTSPVTGRSWKPGQVHMSAWDTARLLWLLDPDAPAPAWTAPDGGVVDARFLSDASKARLVALLHQQAFHDALDTTGLCGKPHVSHGIPAIFPERWARTNEDARRCNALADVTFAHKTGLTWNFGSDAGIVRGIPGRATRHYVIAFFSNLGHRYTDADKVASKDPCREDGVCYTQRIARMAGAIDAEIAEAIGDR